MENIQKFLKSVKKKKFWDIKDTYLYKANLGNHWHIKKFVVLYKHILVNKDEINDNTLQIIAKNFENFCNSINDKKIKKDALDYFFKPDIRKKEQFISFNVFNDEPEYDDNARKFFFLRLLNQGGESRTPIKDRIKVLINNNHKMSEIIEKIPKIKLDEIEKAKRNNKKPRSVNDSVDVIISDYPATIRNDRQLFTYWGYMPSEENGYVLNNIGELIYQCEDQILLDAIGDHQRFKMRLGNPDLDNMEIKKNFTGKEIIKQFREEKDFNDYNTNPTISIFEILKKINSFNITDEYKFIITRIAPFNLNETIKLITESRNNYKKIKFLYENLHVQKKTREFRTTKVSKTENVNKQINNLMYGTSTEKSKNQNVNINSFIKIGNDKISITDKTKFNNYFRIILLIKEILNNNYKELYYNINKDYKIKLIREVANAVAEKDDLNSKEKNKYIKFLDNLKNKIFTKNNFQKNDYNILVENNWEEYISNFDTKILLICYALNLSVNKTQNNINFKLPEFFTKNNVNIKSTENLIKEVIYLYFNENNKLNTSKINLNNTNQITTNSEALTNISPSNIKKSLLKEKEELIFTGEKIEFRRNIKIMRDAYNERNKNIIHGNKNIKIKSDECDICENKVKLDCHHVIPHEFKGPDINLNYVFICKDVCHKLFTFKTSNPEKALDAINTLKLKNLINIENFKTLINKRLINTKHLKYLLYFNYIHLGGYLELLKNFNKVNKISEINDDKELIKTKLGKSKNRWFRLQATTYFFREFHDIIMQKKNSNFPKNLCDGGCNTDILKSEKECHHIIPKEKKYKRHKNKPLNGPESPFNYAFLCRNCHRYFTDDKEYQFNIINHFKKIGLVNKENTYQMILNDDLNIDQLDFLKVDNYIDQADYIWLKEKIELRDYYRSN